MREADLCAARGLGWMIHHGDLGKPAQILVCERPYRTWWTLWMRKSFRTRVVFSGCILHVSHDVSRDGLEDRSKTTVVLEDVESVLAAVRVERVA